MRPGWRASEGWKPLTKHRVHDIEFKRQVGQECPGGETLNGLAKRHDIPRKLIRVWVETYEAGAFDEDARAAIRECSGRPAPRPPGALAGGDGSSRRLASALCGNHVGTGNASGASGRLAVANLRCDFRSLEGAVAGGPGFEPRLPESESGVLPLNYPPPTGGRAGVRLRARGLPQALGGGNSPAVSRCVAWRGNALPPKPHGRIITLRR